MITRIKTYFAKLRWIKNGRSMVSYPGFHCCLCGKWKAIPFSIPLYESAGEWWDTWGYCKGLSCEN